ncbi:MAG: hypothetical protein WC789_13760 [Lentisphaeria bacterium]
MIDGRTKEERAKKRAAIQAQLKGSPMVRVKVIAAIAVGGTRIAPTMDGEKKIPADCVIPRQQAVAFGPAYVQIVADAPDGAKIGPVAP